MIVLFSLRHYLTRIIAKFSDEALLRYDHSPTTSNLNSQNSNGFIDMQESKALWPHDSRAPAGYNRLFADTTVATQRSREELLLNRTISPFFILSTGGSKPLSVYETRCWNPVLFSSVFAMNSVIGGGAGVDSTLVSTDGVWLYFASVITVKTTTTTTAASTRRRCFEIVDTDSGVTLRMHFSVHDSTRPCSAVQCTKTVLNFFADACGGSRHGPHYISTYSGDGNTVTDSGVKELPESAVHESVYSALLEIFMVSVPDGDEEQVVPTHPAFRVSPLLPVTVQLATFVTFQKSFAGVPFRTSCGLACKFPVLLPVAVNSGGGYTQELWPDWQYDGTGQVVGEVVTQVLLV